MKILYEQGYKLKYFILDILLAYSIMYIIFIFFHNFVK